MTTEERKEEGTGGQEWKWRGNLKEDLGITLTLQKTGGCGNKDTEETVVLVFPC